MSSTPDQVLKALAQILAPLVARELGATASTDVYTSSDLPPEIRHLRNPRRVFAETLRRNGRGEKRGKDWIVPRAEWFEIRRQPTRSRPVLVSAEEREIDLDAELDAAGLRPTRSS